MNKQTEILKHLATVPQATLAEIYENVSFGYYHNGHKHIGTILNRMVKSKKIERIKKGVFRYISYTEFVADFNKNQNLQEINEGLFSNTNNQ